MKFLIKRKDGRYYGHLVWTFDIERACKFPSKEAAEKLANKDLGHTVIPYPVS